MLQNASKLIALNVFINDHKKQLHNVEVIYESCLTSNQSEPF